MPVGGCSSFLKNLETAKQTKRQKLFSVQLCRLSFLSFSIYIYSFFYRNMESFINDFRRVFVVFSLHILYCSERWKTFFLFVSETMLFLCRGRFCYCPTLFAVRRCSSFAFCASNPEKCQKKPLRAKTSEFIPILQKSLHFLCRLHNGFNCKKSFTNVYIAFASRFSALFFHILFRCCKVCITSDKKRNWKIY